MQQNRTLIGIGAVVLIAAALYFIFTNGAEDVGKVDLMNSTNSSGNEAPLNEPAMQEEADVPMDKNADTGDMDSEDQATENSITIDMANYSFTPAIIEAAPGDRITVKLTNSGGFHDFVIDELNVASAPINTGDEAMVVIDVPENPDQNEYVFYCSVGNHRQLGMEGVLRISK